VSLQDDVQELNIQYLHLLHQACRNEDPEVVSLLFGVDSESIQIIRDTPATQLTRAATRGGFALSPRVRPQFWRELKNNDVQRAMIRQAFDIVS